ncbi:MAG: hypothetical protein ACREBG_23640 [Pyrinomonadaceae bacterium]
MSETVPTKRRRGGQPRNTNARNNPGNPNPRRNHGNRGGKGAPRGNRFARKPRRPASTILFEDYKNSSEALEWIEDNRTVLDLLEISDERRIDRATLYACRGLTPEKLAELRQELRFGLCSRDPTDEFRDEEIAA